jgi:hypothetical protein
LRKALSLAKPGDLVIAAERHEQSMCFGAENTLGRPHRHAAALAEHLGIEAHDALAANQFHAKTS